MKLIRLFALAILVSLFTGVNAKAQHNSHSLADELHTMYDISSLPAYRTNSFSAQVSTYDPTGGNNDGFGGQWSFLRRNADSSLVIFDVKGAGVVNRFWTPTPTNDTLDFYIDDSLHPALSVCYMDLFSGKIIPFALPLCGNQLGGYYCYFPILFQHRCIIICRGKHMQFHQIQYRLFEPGAIVKPFSVTLNESEKEALKKIDMLWNKPGKKAGDFVTGNYPLQTINTTATIQAGETKAIAAINKGGRITGIEIGPAAVFEGLYKNIDIRVFWDDEKQPAIDCPVADFFGYAFGKQTMQSLLLGSKGNRNYCYFPMPFDKKAHIELVYRKQKDSLLPPLQFHATVSYTGEARRPNQEGKLFTNWVQNQPAEGKPHVFLDVAGRGHYVATLLQAQGLHPGMTIFFEGDDSTVIDGSMRLHGTGSEDSFNGGWYALLDRWDTRMSLPLHGALDYSLIFSRTGGYRLYINDKLSFEKSLYHSIEHGPEHNAVPAIYTSVCFYYNSTPVKKRQRPSDAETVVYIPDTLNIFPGAIPMVMGEEISVKDAGADLTVTGNSKLKISLADVLPGKYKLFASYHNQSDDCSFSLWQRQTQITPWIKGAAEKNKYLGDINLTELNNAVTFHFNTSAPNGHFIWDKLMLVKIK